MMYKESFDIRKEIGEKIKCILVQKRYTKFSFCHESGISRPTLDRFLEGEISNKTTFDRHYGKILRCLSLDEEKVNAYTLPEKEIIRDIPSEFNMNEKARDQFDLITDFMLLCGNYYREVKNVYTDNI